MQHAGILRADDNMQGIIFDLNGKRLEIMEETKAVYICMDVTKSLWPDPIKIIAVEKLNILTRISNTKIFERQKPIFSTQVKIVQEKMEGCTLTKKLVPKGKKFKIKR